MSRKRKRAKLAAPEPLGQVIDRAGESRFARQRLPVGPQTWTEVVGLRIAERARPVALERGVLTVRVATNVWATELAMLSSAIVERLRGRGLDVQSLRFTVGAVEPPARPIETRSFRRIPPPAVLPPELAPSLEAVEDDGLRSSIAAAARAHLAWRAHVGSDRAAVALVRGAMAASPAPSDSPPDAASDHFAAHLNVARRSSPSRR